MMKQFLQALMVYLLNECSFHSTLVTLFSSVLGISWEDLSTWEHAPWRNPHVWRLGIRVANGENHMQISVFFEIRMSGSGVSESFREITG
jgi:hypothetical protein